MAEYLSLLDPGALLRACPGGIAQGLIWGIMALGVYFTFRILDLADLTVDGSFATGGAVCIMLIVQGWNPELALVVCCLTGIVAGIVTGLLHTKLGIPAILAGILTQISLYSINLNIMGKANQAINAGAVSLRITSNALLLWRTIGISAAVALALIAILYCYLGTENGCAFRATGNNQAMSRAQGINVDRMKIIGLALSNGLVALSGGMLSQYQGFADVNMGRGAIVIGLAAVIIGEALGKGLTGKYFNFFGRMAFTVFGGVVYYLVVVVVLWLRLNSNDLKLITALIVALFLAMPHLREQRKSAFRQSRKEAAPHA